MWGDITPAERLRALARRGGGDDLAAEATAALAGYADDPASLVVACRRLLAHHADHAPLLWACSRLLTATEPAGEARRIIERLRDDATGRHLAAALPLLDDHSGVVALGWDAAIDEATAERVDLPVVAVRARGADPVTRLRHRRSDRTIRVIDTWEQPPYPAGVLLVPAVVIGPDRAVVAAGFDEVHAALAPAASWLIGGEGRCLPTVLAGRIERTLDPNETASVAIDRFTRAIGPGGAAEPAVVASRTDCPVAPELLGG